MLQSPFAALHAGLQSQVDQQFLAGVSTAVIRDREVVDRFCCGHADREAGEALREDHIFRVFSNTKLVTSCAVLLRESGSGGLVSTLGDMVRLVQALMPGGPTLLKPETLALMAGNQLAEGLHVKFPNMPGNPGRVFGLGSSVLKAAGELSWGGLAGTAWWIPPERRITGMLMTQRDFGFGNPFTFMLRRLAYAAMGGGGGAGLCAASRSARRAGVGRRWLNPGRKGWLMACACECQDVLGGSWRPSADGHDRQLRCISLRRSCTGSNSARSLSISNTRLSNFAQIRRTKRWCAQFAWHTADIASCEVGSGSWGNTSVQLAVGCQHTSLPRQLAHMQQPSMRGHAACWPCHHRPEPTKPSRP